jgi:hypothetical protein
LYLLIQEAFDSLFFPIHSQRALDRLVVVWANLLEFLLSWWAQAHYSCPS